MAQYLIMGSLVAQSISSFESHYRVIKSRDLLKKALVQVAQERMPSYYSFIAFSVAHVQTVSSSKRPWQRKSEKKHKDKAGGKKSIDRETETR